MSITKSQFMKTLYSYYKICAVILLSVYNPISLSSVLGQSICQIGVPTNIPKDTSYNVPSNIEQIFQPPYAIWSSLSEARYANDFKAKSTILPQRRSQTIVANNFGFNLPTGAKIDGIIVHVKGQSSKAQNVDEWVVQLIGADGQPKGVNRANQAKRFNAWHPLPNGTDRTWTYGYSENLWEATWTNEDINSKEFGVRIQLRNKGNDPMTVEIDAIDIEVLYTPLFTFCDDKCLTIFVDEMEQYGSYKWHLPPGFTLSNQSDEMQAIDIKIVDALFGVHTFCVDVYNYNGTFAGRCCRDLHYQNCNSASILGQIWLDYDNDKLKSPNDGFLSGILVTLFDEKGTIVSTTRTKSDGTYSFDNLKEGYYYLGIAHINKTRIILFDGSRPDVNSDITNRFGVGTTDLIFVKNSNQIDNIDFGFTPLIDIGDFVWEDLNYNGLQDIGEPGIPGIKIKLFLDNGTVIDSTITDGNGKYAFQDIAAGSYRLQFLASSDYLPTLNNMSNVNINSKIDMNGFTSIYNLFIPNQYNTIDAGFYKSGNIGGKVWEDRNANGQFEAFTDSGIAGIKVKLFIIHPNGQTKVDSSITDVNGQYLFDSLVPGKYSIEIDIPNGWIISPSNVGNDNLDSDLIDGKIENIEIISGQSSLNNDGGLYRLASIKGNVWLDENADGFFDQNEDAITVAKVLLIDEIQGLDVIIDSTHVDAGGYYNFEDIVPGTYGLKFIMDDAYFSTRIPPNGSNLGNKMDKLGRISSIQLFSNDVIDNLLAGFVLASFIGDFVWEDLNANGIQEPGEPGLKDVTIIITGENLYNESVVDTTFSEEDGFYIISNVLPGRYTIAVDAHGDYFETPKFATTNDLDSDLKDGKTEEFDIISNEVNNTIDFGFYRKSSIRGLVWEDINGNGIRELNEPFLKDVSVSIEGYSGEGTFIDLNVITDSTGVYIFEDLVPGSYKLFLNIPFSYVLTEANIGSEEFDSDFITEVFDFDLSSGLNLENIDAGMLVLGIIGDYVWADANNNGLQDTMEMGISNIVLTIEGNQNNGKLFQSTTITDQTGAYLFDNLWPGTYTISVDKTPRYELTIFNVGDSELNSKFETVVSPIISIESKSEIYNMDLGLIERGSLMGFIWEDRDANGKLDMGESPLANEEVRLEGIDIFGETVAMTVFSDQNGVFEFLNLIPGLYKVLFNLHADWIETSYQIGANPAIDSDVLMGGIDGIMILSGQKIMNLGAGYYRYGGINGLIWEDMDANGERIDIEPLLPIIEVTLSGQTGAGEVVQLSTLTDLNGKYQFDRLKPGMYDLSFNIPNGFQFTKYDVGDPSRNSDVLDNKISIRTFHSGAMLDNLDAGVFRPIIIGDLVWLDLNANGLYETVEDGLEGITVKLKGTNGFGQNIDINTVTNTEGIYNFTNVVPGEYDLSILLPSQLEYTLFQIGNDSLIDSDGSVSPIRIVARSGLNRNDVDFGLVQLNRVDGFVWEDMNCDEIFTTDEPKLENFEVRIVGRDNRGIAIDWVDTTRNDGYFLFPNLYPGDYTLSIILKDDFLTMKSTHSISLNGSLSTNTHDFALFKLAAIGDFVWDDLNQNGIQDDTEFGIAGVNVTLAKKDSPTFIIDSTISDSEGRYGFENIKPGLYTIAFDIPLNYEPTITNVGMDNTKDNDIFQNGKVDVEVRSGQFNFDIDAGFYLIASGKIGSIVWEDMNGNGVREDEEPGLADVIVTLSGQTISGSTLMLMTTTDEMGLYHFNDLPAGEYVIAMDLPVGYEYTYYRQGSNDETDSDILPSLARTNTFVLGQKEQKLHIDGGMFRRGSIGDFIWNDLNQNGLQDDNEQGLEGIVIRISSTFPLNNFQAVGVTNAAGRYQFERLIPGTYNIEVEVPPLYQPTKFNIGGNKEIDSDINNLGRINNFLLLSGIVDNTIDGGLFATPTAQIGDFVWEDLNGNGIQDMGEPGIPNVEIVLFGREISGSNVFYSTVTNENGFYVFDFLNAGTYELRISPPTRYLLTRSQVGTNKEVDSDFNQVTLTTESFPLMPQETRFDLDAGMYRLARVGDYVWNDVNQNGIQDFGEEGIGGVKIDLLDNNGIIITSTTTDSDGLYIFTNLIPGKYKLRAYIPEGFLVTTPFVGDNIINSDFISVNDSLGETFTFELVSGEFAVSYDLGLYLGSSTISGIVWSDDNGNGLIDIEEPAKSNIVVRLLDEFGAKIDSTYTNGLGEYVFDIMNSGNYIIAFETFDDSLFTYFNAGDPLISSDVVTKNEGRTGSIQINNGQNLFGVNGGYVGYSSITGFTWLDIDENGLKDANEVGIDGIKVFLLDNNLMALDSTITAPELASNTFGFYSFNRVPYGSYILKFDTPNGLAFTTYLALMPSINSDVINVDQGITANIPIAPNQAITDIAAGYVLLTPTTGTISGLAWRDTNNDKLRNQNEPLISGLEVRLFNIQGDLIANTTTDTLGAYLFEAVVPGSYYVKATPIDQNIFVLFSNVEKPFDSDITNQFGLGTTRIINIFGGVEVKNIDLGYSEFVTIGDFVWDDHNNNGLQDTGELGIPNVRVNLISEFGNVEFTTLTDQSGMYVFDSIQVGRYVINFESISGYTFGVNTGIDDQRNSKIDSTNGATDLLDFFVPGIYNNIDAAFVKVATIGSRVWLDVNSNGIFQANEPGVSDIKVILFLSNGIKIDSTKTSVIGNDLFQGQYRFENVRPGSYYVYFDIPLNYLLSPSKVGSDDLDSDVTGINGFGTTSTFILEPGQKKLNIDAGIYLPSSIGDRVWNDINQNGIQDQGEPGVSGVKVSIYSSGGTLLGTTTTNNQGIYSFSGLRQALYYLQFDLPNGFQFTSQFAGNDNTLDSDVDAAGTTPLISLAHGALLKDVDAGIFITNQKVVMGMVWDDVNKNGIRDESEVMMPNIEVNLYSKDGILRSNFLTNHAGRYCLTTNIKSEHYVYVHLPVNHVFTYKNSGNNNKFDSDIDESGYSDMFRADNIQTIEYVDAGIYFLITGEIKGLGWKDLNKNNLRDETDELISDLVIFLFNEKKVFIRSLKTNELGMYTFNKVEHGKYYCSVPHLANYDFVMFTGSNQDRDSEITNQFGLGTSRLITIDGNQVIQNFDFGYRPQNDAPARPKIEDDIVIFPNPVLHTFNVKLANNEHPVPYIIVDIDGKVILEGTASDMELIDIDFVRSGKYFILFILENGILTKPLLKIADH